MRNHHRKNAPSPVDAPPATESASDGKPATLFVIATPIGNLEDITLRALRVLGEVDVLACEDTRMTRRIFERHDVKSPRNIFSYHEHNEAAAGARILGLLETGQSVALTTDGGYPGISDPGYRIIAECRERGYRIEVIPGASAVLVALVASGLSTSSFTFKGFPPRKSGPRKSFLAMDSELPHSLVIFESPYRVGKLLQDALEVLGNRLAAVCVELTKKFEEVHRGYLEELAEKFKDKAPKGEITVVIAGSNPKFEKSTPDTEESAELDDGTRLKRSSNFLPDLKRTLLLQHCMPDVLREHEHRQYEFCLSFLVNMTTYVVK